MFNIFDNFKMLYILGIFRKTQTLPNKLDIVMDLETLGKTIAQRRKEEGLTQAKLALRARVSRATITALETGAQRELGFNKIMAILAVLKLDLRVTEANIGRPTLEDLQREVEQ
jgi:DNA-binding XRE family transcriptional regulator